MLLVTLVLGVACLSCASAIEASGSVEDQLQQLQQEFQEKIDQMQMEINELKSTNPVPKSDVSAAFSTRLHQVTTIDDSPVVFGTVDLNIGNGYDEFTGEFEPPLDGVYVLTVYAVTTGDNGGPMYIKNNGDVLCHAHNTQNGDVDTGTCTAIVELTIDDSVRVTGDSSNPAVIDVNRSGFVGHYIGSV